MYDNVIITGGNGDVGSMLFKLYREAGLEICHLGELLSSSNSVILHLAAKSPPATKDKLIESNIQYLRNVVGYAIEHGIKDFVFFSAASVYGVMDTEDVNETESPHLPSFYGLTKLIGEEYLKESGLKTLCLRLPAILGYKNKTNLLSNFYSKLINNEEIEITNHNRFFNNFISIENIFDFLRDVKLIKSHDVINLASNKELTLINLVTLMKELANSNSNIKTSHKSTPFFNISTKRAEVQYNFKPYNPTDVIPRWIQKRIQYEKNQVS